MKLQYFESDSGQFETNSVTDGKPVQIRKNRRDVTEPRMSSYFPVTFLVKIAARKLLQFSSYTGLRKIVMLNQRRIKQYNISMLFQM